MLLLHQTGAVRVGEVVRYTITYTPSLDRILPPPSELHVKVRNTSAIPLRAAYLHGPYTLYVACYPSTFDPNKKHDYPESHGEPDYEPQLKAGGSWSSKLIVPESVREGAGLGEWKEGIARPSFTWVIEVVSQVLFSTTASVHYELLVGRGEKSVSLGFSGVVSSHGAPGRVEDHTQQQKSRNATARGVFTRAVKLRVDDTAALWSTPAFPSYDDNDPRHGKPGIGTREQQPGDAKTEERPRKGKKKKIHLVIITHGLHSNLGADMLYMKESIDATAKKARQDAKAARQQMRKKEAEQLNDFGREAVDERAKSAPDLSALPTRTSSASSTDESSDDGGDGDDDDDHEQVLVRGFNGNAVKTERGIQYLGKRLAKYVLSLTYPDQPFLPVKKTITQSISRTFTGTSRPSVQEGKQLSHKGSTITKDESCDASNLAYQITSISFIGHSLGGLVQTYAIAYIQKHSPEFFDKIRPVNFVAMASPFLGLSNENPMYVRFALDFGLVGRTGQDLGLTWRAPTIARNGWGAMVGPFTNTDDKTKEQDPGAKPLLRILPTGPAHIALKRFRNRSVYSNVVNDGIVPLRTSCLLFLDWRGLGRVEKARRENGLVGTMVNWGLNELTGTNASTPRRGLFEDLFSDSGDEAAKTQPKASGDPGSAVPQAEASSGLDREQYDADDKRDPDQHQMLASQKSPDPNASPNLWSALTNFFRPQAGSQRQGSTKQQKIYQRGQTMMQDESDASRQSSIDKPAADSVESSPGNHRKLLVRGSSLYTNNSDNENLEAPPRTTVFESAGDLLNPPLPPKQYLVDPAARPRTIFHDRVYHPDDIPPPPTKRQRTFMRSRPTTSDDNTVPNQAPEDMSKIASDKPVEPGSMRIEEKIARAYHKDMAWRKVLVRLEPDAHNNIIVRRMFANAYGWPVVKHLCDTHFAYTAAAKTKDEDESPIERAKPQTSPVGKDGEHVRDQTQPPDTKHADEDARATSIATAEDLPVKEDHEIDTYHLRQKNLQAVKQAEKVASRSHRSPSELRESRDQVSDLVSMVSAQGEPSMSYSSMHSGTAALHRLARQDSARWSDRFFESSDDEDEDDETDLNSELQKAYDRGVGNSEAKLGSSPKSNRSGPPSRGRGGNVSGRPRGPSILPEEDQASRLVAEPGQISRRSSRDVDTIAAGYPDPQTLSLTGIGLQRDVRESFSSDRESAIAGVEGIGEQIARASLDGGEKSKSRPQTAERRDTLD